MVNFCRGGYVVPPAQPARLSAGLGTGGRFPALLQGRCLFLFPPYRGEKKGFASALDFAIPLQCFYTPEVVTAYSRQQFQFDQRVFSLPRTGLDFPRLHTQCFTACPELTSVIWRAQCIKGCDCSSCRQRVAKQHSTGFENKNTEHLKTGVTAGMG